MNSITTQVDFYYLDISPFTENDIFKIKNMISNNSGISKLMSFKSFGNISFEDNKHKIWTIDLEEKFKKNHINAIVFDVDSENILENPKNYKYLIIFQNITRLSNSYGYMWVKDDKTLLRFCLEYNSDEIIHHIIRDIHFWKKQPVYDALYSEPKPNIKEFNKIYKKYVETYRCNDYNLWIKNIHETI